MKYKEEELIFTEWLDVFIWVCKHINYEIIKERNVLNETETGAREYAYTILTVKRIW